MKPAQANAAAGGADFSSAGSYRTYRQEVLDAYLFDSIGEVREITDAWLERYKEIRLHDALDSLPPARYRETLLAKNCTLQLST